MKYSIDYIKRKFKELEAENKFDISSALDDIFLMLSFNQFNPLDIQIPNWLSAFYEISTWKGSSLRSGVWTYYEASPLIVMERASAYLVENTIDDIGKIYTYGIHNYQDEKSKEQIEVWVKESEIIDEWISINEILICEWLKILILEHEGFIYDRLINIR